MMKRAFRLIALLLALVLLFSITGVAEQTGDAAEGDVRAEAVEIIATELGETALPGDGNAQYAGVPVTLELGVKEKYALEVKGAAFKSSNRSIATVSKKGVVQGKKKGRAVITVMVGGKKVATCDVTVLAAPKKIKVDPKKLTLRVGEVFDIIPTLPDGTASKITWSSSKKSVAKVDKTGRVTAVKKGKAKITAKTFNGKKATCTVTVKAGNAPTSVSFDVESIALGVGETVTVSPIVNEGAVVKFTWSTADAKIAAVSQEGVITGMGIGETTVTATTQNDLSASLAVRVLEAPSEVTLDVSEAQLDVGGTLQLTATLPENAASQIAWTSSDAKVATVDGGLVTALAAGTVTITATTYNGKQASCAVTISATGPESSLDDFEIKDGVIVKYIGAGGDVVIPSRDKDGNPITAIGGDAFRFCNGLVSVRIPETVTAIQNGDPYNTYGSYGHGAFIACSALESVVLPSGLTSIGSSAFAFCSSLTHIDIPGSVTNLGESVFLKSGIKDITIPYGVTTIKDAAFKECYDLADVNIANSVTKIGHYAFADCTSLESIVIPDTVTKMAYVHSEDYADSMGSHAFDNCTNLKKVILSKGMTKIYRGMFDGCKSLSYIYIPISISSIDGYSPFYSCPDDFTVETEYGSYAFEKFKNTKHNIIISGSHCEPFDITYGGGAPVRMEKTLEAILATADSDKYSPTLARALMALAAAAYNDVKSTGTDGSLLSPEQVPNIGNAYFNLGFEKITTYNYYDSPYAAGYGSDNVAYTVGVKTLVGGHRIVLVTVRGSWAPDGAFDTPDWKSNINMNIAGEKGVHPGFNTAAESVMTGLRETVGSLTDENITFVLTGHSRGAAVANLVAVALRDAGVSNDRVFDYNFACPDVARLDLTYDWVYDHKNMFNISYTADPIGVVPGVAADLIGVAAVGTAWGKYGNTYYFTDEWDSPDEFDLSRIIANPSSHSQALYVQMMENRPESTFHSWSDVASKRLLYFTLTDSVSPILKLIEIIGG